MVADQCQGPGGLIGIWSAGLVFDCIRYHSGIRCRGAEARATPKYTWCDSHGKAMLMFPMAVRVGENTL